MPVVHLMKLLVVVVIAVIVALHLLSIGRHVQSLYGAGFIAGAAVVVVDVAAVKLVVAGGVDAIEKELVFVFHNEKAYLRLVSELALVEGGA